MKKSTAVSAAKNELTIGLDLGDRKHHACVLSAAGDIFREEVLPNTRECVLAFAQRFPGTQKDVTSRLWTNQVPVGLDHLCDRMS